MKRNYLIVLNSGADSLERYMCTSAFMFVKAISYSNCLKGRKITDKGSGAA